MFAGFVVVHFLGEAPGDDLGEDVAVPVIAGLVSGGAGAAVLGHGHAGDRTLILGGPIVGQCPILVRGGRDRGDRLGDVAESVVLGGGRFS
ncbi:hypothetical protein D3C74_430500 [compost metagenome]